MNPMRITVARTESDAKHRAWRALRCPPDRPRPIPPQGGTPHPCVDHVHREDRPHKAGIRPSGLTALCPAPPPLRTGTFWKDGSKRLPTLPVEVFANFTRSLRTPQRGER